jgi:hypothetical protein
MFKIIGGTDGAASRNGKPNADEAPIWVARNRTEGKEIMRLTSDTKNAPGEGLAWLLKTGSLENQSFHRKLLRAGRCSSTGSLLTDKKCLAWISAEWRNDAESSSDPPISQLFNAAAKKRRHIEIVCGDRNHFDPSSLKGAFFRKAPKIVRFFATFV